MKVHIIGGGIIGLSTAYFLQQEGVEVTIIDKSDWSDSCSHGNAGMIAPSHFIPLAAPGVIAQGLRWMFSAKSPFYIRPRLSLSLANWLWQFYRSCNKEKVAQAAPMLRDFNWLSQSLYKQLAAQPALNFAYEEKGLLMLCEKERTFKEEAHHAEMANELGIEAKVLSASEVSALEKGLMVRSAGGVFYPGDSHLYPNQLIAALRAYLTAQGVQFIPQTGVVGFEDRAGRIDALLTTDGQRLGVDQVVLAAGSWSGRVLKKLGLKMLLEDGKGYSVTLKDPARRPGIPTILTEAKVAVTPMGTDLRIGGTLEISNLNPSINYKRLQGILESMPRYYPDYSVNFSKEQAVWHGFRPCTPDGLPYIGRYPKFANLIVATGHAMMGLSLGPATGQLVSDVLMNKKDRLDMRFFSPTRFG